MVGFYFREDDDEDVITKTVFASDLVWNDAFRV